MDNGKAMGSNNIQTKTTERENKRKVISKWERITKKINSFTVETLRLQREGIA
jgi:hypothetical protein